MTSCLQRSHHGLLRRFLLDTNGATTVEFALVAVPLFLLIMTTIECGIIYHISALATEAGNEAARLGKTGSLYGTTDSRMAMIRDHVRKRMSPWVKDQNDLTIKGESYGSFNDIGTGGVGGAGKGDQIVLYTVTFHWTLFSPPLQAVLGRRVPIEAMSLVKNEAFE